jgi:dTDP-4-dehydrorhamnose 3,5-epimerase
MRFNPTPIDGVFIVETTPGKDERGFFARWWCAAEAREHGLRGNFDQTSVSHNFRRSTLRGLHFQKPPNEEEKVVRVISGAVFDVAVDLRPGSPTFKGWHGVELSALNQKALYISKGVAHGFLTLTDDARLLYMISPAFAPESACGVRWNDPAFGVAWPGVPEVISPRDASYPDFQP